MLKSWFVRIAFGVCLACGFGWSAESAEARPIQAVLSGFSGLGTQPLPLAFGSNGSPLLPSHTLISPLASAIQNVGFGIVQQSLFYGSSFASMLVLVWMFTPSVAALVFGVGSIVALAGKSTLYAWGLGGVISGSLTLAWGVLMIFPFVNLLVAIPTILIAIFTIIVGSVAFHKGTAPRKQPEQQPPPNRPSLPTFSQASLPNLTWHW